MQGWRKKMEDSHIADLNVVVDGKKYNIFGVFDGHGGKFKFLYFIFR
jgi:serine/threonine protein phosphatase PrpC